MRSAVKPGEMVPSGGRGHEDSSLPKKKKKKKKTIIRHAGIS
jgi:hypothetical protein